MSNPGLRVQLQHFDLYDRRQLPTSSQISLYNLFQDYQVDISLQIAIFPSKSQATGPSPSYGIRIPPFNTPIVPGISSLTKNLFIYVKAKRYKRILYRRAIRK